MVDFCLKQRAERSDKLGTVKISPGNSKLGAIPSVSLPSGLTCRACACQKKCYAGRLERMRKNVAEAYAHNLNILRNDPDVYWREIEAAIMMSHFFRFHVSGDIPDMDYLTHMIDVSARNPHCQVLCFTKKYELVNEHIMRRGHLPNNLHMIFSGWVGLDMVNPFSLPEAHVRYRDGSTTAAPGAIDCGGNCTECALTDGGCWSLQTGEQVVFLEH